MSGDRSSDLVTHARELERRDADLAVRIDGVADVQHSVDELRDAARRVRARLEAIPDEIEHAELAERNALEREAAALSELADAERQLEEIAGSRRGSADATARGEQAVRRAAVAAADAAATTVRLRERHEALIDKGLGLRAEAETLVAEAQQVARRVFEVPRLSDSGRTEPGSIARRGRGVGGTCTRGPVRRPRWPRARPRAGRPRGKRARGGSARRAARGRQRRSREAASRGVASAQ